MSAEPDESVARGEWQGPQTGRWYATTKFHWHKREVVICPACDSRPCAPQCAEQVTPDPRGQRWEPSGDLPATPPPADSEPVVPEQPPAPAGRLVGNGNPRQLVSEAFREAAKRTAEALGAAAEEG